MYDQKCHNLAVDFLIDEAHYLRTSKNIEKIAQAIQDAIEAELEDIRTPRPERVRRERKR